MIVQKKPGEHNEINLRANSIGGQVLEHHPSTRQCEKSQERVKNANEVHGELELSHELNKNPPDGRVIQSIMNVLKWCNICVFSGIDFGSMAKREINDGN